MKLFEARSSRIFIDAKWLQPLCPPPEGKPICRDLDLKVMADFLSEVFRTGQARNLFIYGRSGTGKTVCVHYLLMEIRKHANQIKADISAIYVNAGRTRTPYYTLLEIVRSLGTDVPDSGWQMFRLKAAFENAVRKKAAVIAIDEVDSIIFKEKEPLVYYLNRQLKTTLILISNKIEDAAQLPERVLSTLQPKIIKLEPYTKEEAKAILKERSEHAFQPSSISEELIGDVAETTSNLRDIRLGFSIMLSAGLAAERAGRAKIEEKDIESAIRSESKLEALKKMDALKKQLQKLRKR